MSSRRATEVRSVLLPLAQDQLLLPNVVVAEVMNYSEPKPKQETPVWLLGELAWRGTLVPVVSIEGLLGRTIGEPGFRSRLIILNTINGTASLPHIALIAHSIPTLIQVTAESIESVDPPETPGGLIKQTVKIDDKTAYIPDLDELERLILDTPGLN
ncbi:MAG: chemotaxis protein CheW [Gammaproteobacteria bacterium]|nr:chemotaxis protein CheW [Gammaproteobacteria bacterium]